MTAIVQCLRVIDSCYDYAIDLPELRSLSCGGGGLCFKDAASSTLIMRSLEASVN